MLRITFLLIGMFVVFSSVNPSWARRENFTPEQREKLAKAQTVLAEAIAITDKGTAPSKEILETISQRLEGAGYTVVTDPAKPHDVVFRAKCEQRKTWEGTIASGGDADLPDSPSVCGKDLPANSTISWMEPRSNGKRKFGPIFRMPLKRPKRQMRLIPEPMP
jgi:hypothetical protein